MKVMTTIEQCERCIGSVVCQKQVVNECLPVNAFGNVSEKQVEVATIGLNPALNEFRHNGIAIARNQRLPILSDYNTAARIDLKAADVDDAKRRREEYFRNHDREWHSYFEKMEFLLARIRLSWSYFWGSAVHIDMVACATEVRWSGLSNGCQSELLTNCRGHFLATLSRLPDGTMLLFDGARVTAEMRHLGLQYEQNGGVQLINMTGMSGCLGTLKCGDKAFPFRSWSIPASKLTIPWRYDLAHWVRVTLSKSNP